MNPQIKLYDFEPVVNDVYQDVLAGLRKPNKELPDTLYYDEHGSQLFDRLCETDDYYLTRTELAIMRKEVGEMVALIGEKALLIEYGSGTSLKTRILLDHLPQSAGYVPIDISKEHLMKAAIEIAKQYPDIEVLPVCADYSQRFDVPSPTQSPSRRVAYYPGSTIGHLQPSEAIAFLRRVREVCGPNSGLLIGLDLKKDPGVLSRAYKDSTGAASAFTFNILTHANWRFSANFDLDQFEYDSYYNEALGRIEVYLISKQDQTVDLNRESISFMAGEKIKIAYSYKYNLDEFTELSANGGWTVQQVWTDDGDLFSVQYLTSI